MLGGYYTFDFGDEVIDMGTTSSKEVTVGDSSVFARRDKPIRIKINLRYNGQLFKILSDSTAIDTDGSLCHIITTLNFDNDTALNVVFVVASDSSVGISVVLF